MKGPWPDTQISRPGGAYPSAHISRQRKAHVGFLMFNLWYLADGICVTMVLARGVDP